MSRLYITKELKNYRVEKGWTQEQMADMLAIVWKRPVSMSAYQKWEQGSKNITPDRALDLSTFTKISLRKLAVWK